METDRLIDEYLNRLEEAAAHLQRSRRAELVAEIREHIEAALRQEDADNEVAVRNVLERLGEPEEIVEAAEPAPPPAETRRSAGKLEIAALVALVVPLIGWLVGTVLVLASGVWTRREKIIGLAILAAVLLLPAVGFTLGTAESGLDESTPTDMPVGGEEPSTEGVGALEALVLFGLGVPSALYLGWRLNRHPRQLA